MSPQHPAPPAGAVEADLGRQIHEMPENISVREMPENRSLREMP
jgi:hypothetical protein